jgi:hypothetical protein
MVDGFVSSTRSQQLDGWNRQVAGCCPATESPDSYRRHPLQVVGEHPQSSPDSRTRQVPQLGPPQPEAALEMANPRLDASLDDLLVTSRLKFLLRVVSGDQPDHPRDTSPAFWSTKAIALASVADATVLVARLSHDGGRQSGLSVSHETLHLGRAWVLYAMVWAVFVMVPKQQRAAVQCLASMPTVHA